MKIGIAINGEGRGHFSRARALAEELKKKHEVQFWVADHLIPELAECFPGSKIFGIPYLKCVQRGFYMDYFKTLTANAALFFFPQTTWRKIAKQLRASGTDVVLSDFEPFTSGAAKMIGLPVLQLNHPGIVTRCGTISIKTFFAKLIASYMMANSDRTILCSFFGGDVGPIIRSGLRNKKITRGDYFVVYQKATYREYLAPILEALSAYTFAVFPDPSGDYESSLAGCRAVIAPAGHQSISEALALGKPIFAIPVQGQFEQELNAQKLRESGFGDYSSFDELYTALPRFLETVEKYENAIAKGRMTGYAGKHAAWACQDETMRAVALVENFISDSKTAPAWKRKTILSPLYQE